MMSTKHSNFFYMMCIFEVFTGRILVNASTDNKEDQMKLICVALKYEYDNKLAASDLQMNEFQFTYTSLISLTLEKNGRSITSQHDAGLCVMNWSNTRCIIDGDKENEFSDYSKQNGANNCSPDSNTRIKIKSEYLKKGEDLKVILLQKKLPDRKPEIGKAICDDEKSMKKICVGLRTDYHMQDTSYKAAKLTEKMSKCQGSDDTDEYRVALCYLNSFFVKCITDGYDEDEFISSSYHRKEEKPKCAWDSGIEIRKKKKYLENGDLALRPKGFLGFLRRWIKFLTG